MKFKTVSLTRILDEFKAPKIIQYLSLDVEGAEEDIFLDFPFHKWKFLTMTIERPTEKLHQKLVQNKYWFLRSFSNWGETMYIHESLKGFRFWMDKFRKDPVPQNYWGKWWDNSSYLFVPAWDGYDGKICCL
jgi:hypothetical protein